MSDINIDDLSEEQKEKLLSNPQIQRMLTYEDSEVPALVEAIRSLQEGDEFELADTDEVASDGTYSLIVEGVADEAGRTTASTVNTVLTTVVEHYENLQE